MAQPGGPLSNRFLVAVDFGVHTARTIEYAIRLADADTRIDLVHVLVGRPPVPAGMYPAAQDLVKALTEQERSYSETRLSELLDTLPEVHRGDCLLRDGPPPEVICEVAKEVGHDLIAVSTHGRSGLQQLLIGSVAERVVRMAPCSVVVVR